MSFSIPASSRADMKWSRTPSQTKRAMADRLGLAFLRVSPPPRVSRSLRVWPSPGLSPSRSRRSRLALCKFVAFSVVAANFLFLLSHTGRADDREPFSVPLAAPPRVRERAQAEQLPDGGKDRRLETYESFLPALNNCVLTCPLKPCPCQEAVAKQQISQAVEGLLSGVTKPAARELPNTSGKHREAGFGKQDGARDLHSIALRYQACNGLTNQRIALIEGVLLGMLLGIQIIVPGTIPHNGIELPGRTDIDRNYQRTDTIFNVERFVAEGERLFIEHWCHRNTRGSASHVWCGGPQVKPVLYTGNVEEELAASIARASSLEHWGVQVIPLEDLLVPPRPFPSSALGHLQEELNQRLLSSPADEGGYTVIDASCTLFSIPVKEGTRIWEAFWRLSRALDFASGIERRGQALKKLIRSRAEAAREKAARFGFRADVSPGLKQAPYNVLHFRAEKDWIEHCNVWMNLDDGVHRDNCMNNTMSVANVLLSEGVPPSIPLYISSGLTRRELLDLEITHNLKDQTNERGAAFDNLFNVYTVICKEDVMELTQDWATAEREVYAALDFLVARDALHFIGNSVSTFSAYILIERQTRGKLGFHYNGGNVPIASAGFLRPSKPMALPTFRTPLKWVFAIHVNPQSGLSSSFVNMMKVAVLSARQRTSLVAVCLTTMQPSDDLAVWLVQNGVRVLYHKPLWMAEVRDRVATQTKIASMGGGGDPRARRSHLLADPDAMIGTFLRVDIPVAGLLDEFVLYTDVDCLFSGSVGWQDLLGARYVQARAQADFAGGKFYADPPGQVGLPLFFSASSEMERRMDPAYLNAGVMLLNMRNLRSTYADFLGFIFKDGDLDWDAGPGDQGAYKTFYAEGNGNPAASFLPFELNWKAYWERNERALIVHFHGPKCETDIIPYRALGKVVYSVFEMILGWCKTRGDCYARCDEFLDFLEGPGRNPVNSLVKVLKNLEKAKEAK